MERYEMNVAIVMDFLSNHSYGASVISGHRICYRELRDYLTGSNKPFSFDVACEWLDDNQDHWNYRKYTSFKHCINQLCDVYSMGTISKEHLGPQGSAYSLLSSEYKQLLASFQASNTLYLDDRYRISCSRFLLYLQNNGVTSINQLSYEMLLQFHNQDFHRSCKSKDVYEDLIRSLLRFCSNKGLCSVGLSFALSKLLVHQIVTLDDIDPEIVDADNGVTITYDSVLEFYERMNNARYSKTVLMSTKHTLNLMYIFLDMHQLKLSKKLMWHWFDTVKPLLKSNWKQARRSLYQFWIFTVFGEFVTEVTGDPSYVNSLQKLPEWQSIPLKEYLNLLKREGWKKSTITMQRSSNIRFCKFLASQDIKCFNEVTAVTIENFNMQDHHSTPEGKAAYNCRIRSFILYLFEEGLVKEPLLFKALPTVAGSRENLVKTLSSEELSTILNVNPNSLEPKALRDYVMVMVGLTMGFRASDISNLCFNNIDWKAPSITLTQQKTGKLIKMPLPIKTGNLLYLYLRKGRPQSDCPYIFIRHEAPYDRIQRGVCGSALKRFLKTSSVNTTSFHAVRKTFATKLLYSGTKVGLISESLGHSSDSTVYRYLSLDEERMRLCALSLSDTDISLKGGAFHA